MKHCNACQVNVDTPIRRCPLCFTTLVQTDNTPEERTYPDLSGQVEAYNLLLRILLFVSIAIVAISVTVNLVTPTRYPWSLVVAICVAYIWVTVGTVIGRRGKIGYNIMVQLISLCLIMIILGWIFDFSVSVYTLVIPALIGSGLLSFNILLLFMRQEVKNSILYFFIVALLGFIPLILYLIGFIKIGWPAITLALYSGLFIVSIFIFANRTAKSELEKRFKL